MENNNEQMIISLMQNLVDKLDKISDEIKSKDDKIQLLISENYKLQTDKIIDNLKLNAKLYREKSTEIYDTISNKIENQKSKPNINNHRHFSLLGEKSSLKSKQIVLVLFGLTFLWGFLKYVPEYYIEYSELKKEKENYQLFYNWIFLSQFENDDIIDADDILKDIKARDSLLMEKYNMLLIEYDYEIKRQELEKQLDSLRR